MSGLTALTDLTALTAENFNKETAKGKVLVDFWAPWCAPCEGVKKMLGDLKGVRIGLVDVSREAALANQFEVRVLPTLLMMKDGQVMKQFSGVPSRKGLDDFVRGCGE